MGLFGLKKRYEQKNDGRVIEVLDGAQALPQVIDSRVEEAYRPIIASARTGLGDTKNTLMVRMPETFIDPTVRDYLDYMLGLDYSTETERQGQASLDKIFKSKGFSIQINDRDARLDDRVKGYMIPRERMGANGDVKRFYQVEIVISSVVQGGSIRY
jgi:hypothetical protein